MTTLPEANLNLPAPAPPASPHCVEMTTLPEANLNRWDARVRAQEAAARWEAGKEDAG